MRKSTKSQRPSLQVLGGSIVATSENDKGRTVLEIPGVEIIRVIGNGAHGQVFEAKDALGRDVALKLWFNSRSEKRFQRAQDEVRKLTTLGIHPLIIVVHSFGREKGFPYAVMELVRGTTLKTWLSDQKPEFSERYHIWKMVYGGLRVLYNNNLLHGDPHAGNIVVFEDALGICKAAYPSGCVDCRPQHKLGVKVLDFGTSLLWNSKRAFLRREIKIITETAERIFSADAKTFGRASAIIDLRDIASPRVVLEGLNAYADYISTLSSLVSYLEQRYWHTELATLFERICNVTVYTPLFNVVDLMKSLKAFKHPDVRVPREIGSSLVGKIYKSIASDLKKLEIGEYAELRRIFIHELSTRTRPDIPDDPLYQIKPMYSFYDWLGRGEYARIMRAGRKALNIPETDPST